MHRSRLSSFIIDCQTGDVDAAATFWSQALGRKATPITPPDPLYRELETQPHELLLVVQKVDHPSRIHLDIESDDLEAEAARLEKLGAKRVAFVKRWWVMEAPTGQRFCIINPQRGPLENHPDANVWED